MNNFLRKNSIIVTALGTLFVVAVGFVTWRTRVADTQADSVPMQTIVHDTLADLSAEELVHASDIVVIGTITNVKGFKAASHIRKGKEDIFSDVTVAVEEYLVNTTGTESPDLTCACSAAKLGLMR